MYFQVLHSFVVLRAAYDNYIDFASQFKKVMKYMDSQLEDY